MKKVTTLVKLDCGKHFGREYKKCAKCEYYNQLSNDPKYADYRRGLQWNGTPWGVILGDKLEN